MARDFVRSSSQYLETLSTPITATPLTMACWFNADNVTAQHILLGIYEPTGSTADNFFLSVEGAQANDPFRANVAANNSYASSSANGTTAGTWNHGCGVYTSDSSRTAYLNGVAGTTDTNARTPNAGSLDRVLVGRFQGGATIVYCDALIAEAALWNVALSADEVASLAKGVSPLLVRPDSLAFYAPIYGTHGPEPELIGGRDLTVQGGATKAAHPRIFLPTAKILTFPSAGGSSLNVSATTDALTLAEHQATIGLSLNVSANTDALTLAEHAATVSLASGLNVSATADSLTLAEHAATIGLSLNVQATTDALTLTEYPANLGSVTNVQANTDSLTLTEYPATLSFALNFTANTDSLTLTEYAATVSDGSAPVVTPNPSTGGARGRPGRVYAPVASPKKKKRADTEAVSKTPQKAPESPESKPYTVAGNLGAITKAPTGSPIEPVKTAQIIPIKDYVEKSALDRIIEEAIESARERFERDQAEKKVLERLEEEESFLSWEETESLLLLAMVE
jgi:hypothetical protein